MQRRRHPTLARNDRPPTDVPIYWFFALERAVEEADFHSAAEAQKQLERLGIYVRYHPPRAEAVSRA